MSKRTRTKIVRVLSYLGISPNILKKTERLSCESIKKVYEGKSFRQKQCFFDTKIKNIPS